MGDQLIKHFKCDECHRPLSYFPISLTIDGNFCGRCAAARPEFLEDASRNSIYERMVAFQRFPCCYKGYGCHKTYLPEEVPEHENNCEFRMEECPFGDCRMATVASRFISHCEGCHPELKMEEHQDFDIDLACPDGFVGFFICNNDLLIVNCQNDQEMKKLTCLVTLFQVKYEEINYSFKLIFKNLKDSFTLDIGVGTEIDYADLNDGKITASFTIVKPLNTLAEDQENILSALKCNMCSDYVLPPIYSLPQGTVCCGDCSDGYPYELPTNITINNLAYFLPYPCENKEAGCKFMGVPDVIDDHQNKCPFRDVECCLLSSPTNECLWKGQFSDFQFHVDEAHPFILNGSLICFQLNQDHWIHSLIKFQNTLFDLICFEDNKELCWFLMKVNGMDGKFKYTIELQDVNEKRDCLLVRKSCANFQMIPICHLLHNHDRVIRISKDQITNFMTKTDAEQDCLFFRLDIFSVS